MVEIQRLGIVLPALNAGDSIGVALAALAHGASRFTQDVVVVDGGSSDDTVARAETQGARIISAPPGRGGQLAAGAQSVLGDWLLFVHSDTVLARDWPQAVRSFVTDPANAERAAYFRLTLDDEAPGARRVERLARWRAHRLGLPYGDQGLVISRDFYESLGGYRELALMEDVDLVRRIGRRRLTALDPAARTSARRYRQDGYWRRPLRNLLCLALFYLRVPGSVIQRLYG